MRSTYAVFSLGILLVALLLPGCKQGEGDRCNYNEDCSDDLVCCVTPENRVVGGICVLPLQCDLTGKDGGTVTPDSGTKDMAAQPDSEAADAAADQGTDLAPDQAVTPDLSPDTQPPTPDTTSASDSGVE